MNLTGQNKVLAGIPINAIGAQAGVFIFNILPDLADSYGHR